MWKEKKKVAAGEGVEECGSLHLLLFTPFFFLLSVILSRRRRDCRIPRLTAFHNQPPSPSFLTRPSFFCWLFVFFFYDRKDACCCCYIRPAAHVTEKKLRRRKANQIKKREREEKKVRSGINNRHKQKWEKAVARKRRVGASFYTTRIGEVFLLLLLRTSVIRGGGDAQCVSARLASLCAST